MSTGKEPISCTMRWIRLAELIGYGGLANRMRDATRRLTDVWSKKWGLIPFEISWNLAPVGPR